MPRDPNQTVTAEQLEVIALYASGYELRQIALMKFLSYSAVQTRLTRARERVGAKTLAQLCVICYETGLLSKNGLEYMPIQEERVV